jgi:hypothetical protein
MLPSNAKKNSLHLAIRFDQAQNLGKGVRHSRQVLSVRFQNMVQAEGASYVLFNHLIVKHF